jgi:hypothetical protein
MLKLRDPFVVKSHAPIQVTIEAKDNDPLLGPKWGSSPAITLVPPDVGEPQARRLEALRKLRDALVDSLAWRLANGPPAELRARKAFVDAERSRAEGDDKTVKSTLAQSFGGIRLSPRLRAMVVAQQEKTRRAVDTELRALSTGTHAQAARATERFVLVVDAIIRGLGVHDARESSRELADSADELAAGALTVQTDSDRDARARAMQRMDAATLVLGGGGRAMTKLGELGLDLGEIIDADLLRVKRARDGADFPHGELAARDLAARLREPDPSFGSEGHVRRAGGESGGGRGTAGENDGEGAGDEVDRAQQEAQQDLERLAQDHAGAISDVERALQEAMSEDEKRELRDEAKRHAEAVRDAARGLPAVGMGSDSWTSKGSAARELAEQMARSIEELRPDDAVQSGHSATGALDEAKKMLQKGSWMDDPSGEGEKRVEEARRRLEAETKWAEQQREQLRRRANDRARKQLEENAAEEGKMADRARDLGQKGRDRGSLPDEALQSIGQAERAARQASEALRRGDAEHGLDRQREAQRDLEAARQQLEGSEDEGQGRESASEGDGRQPSKEPVNIPGKGKHKGPEEFRQRVLRGLSQPSSGSLKDAVHRYAEGLLR